MKNRFPYFKVTLFSSKILDILQLLASKSTGISLLSGNLKKKIDFCRTQTHPDKFYWHKKLCLNVQSWLFWNEWIRF